MALPVEASWWEARRWFAGKGRGVAAVAELDAFALPGTDARLVVAELTDDAGARARYAVPLAAGDADEAAADDPLWGALGALAAGGERAGRHGRLVGAPGVAAGLLAGAAGGAPSALEPDASNTVIGLGDAVALKVFRRLEAGPRPEVELCVALAGAGVRAVPPVAGAVALVAADGTAHDLALAQGLVVGAEQGWARAGRELAACLGGAAVDPGPWARALGSGVAEIHAALVAGTGGLATRRAETGDAQAARAGAGRALEAALAALDGAPRDELAAAAPRIAAELEALARLAGQPLARVHGDLHIGQVLTRGDALAAVLDFDGDPLLPLAERRRLATPLRDLATLLRSFAHAAAWEARDAADATAARAWARRARAACVDGYAAGLAAHGVPLVLDHALVRALEWEKAAWEFAYAATYLPSWLVAPRTGLAMLLEEDAWI